MDRQDNHIGQAKFTYGPTERQRLPRTRLHVVQNEHVRLLDVPGIGQVRLVVLSYVLLHLAA